MCCGSNRFGCGCGCQCGCGGSGCGCGWGCGGVGGGSWIVDSGVATLPSFPDRPVFEPVVSGVSSDFPVYVSLPASMTRGSANLRAAVNLDSSGSGCPFARG